MSKKTKRSNDKKDETNYENESYSNKPRRLEEETIVYLQSLNDKLNDSTIDSNEKDILVNNVLDEVKQRTASAISDRRTHFIMENLIYLCTMNQLLDIMARCSPYSVFLASNRHSSHVQQAMISRFCYLIKFDGLKDLDELFVCNTILEFVKPLFNEITTLISDLNASHVIRSSICLLAGIPTIAEKKGNDSKHRHSVSLSEPLDRLVEPKKFYIKKSASFDVPEEFHEILGSAVITLIDLNSSDLQQMIVDPTSAAVFSLLIRILSNQDFILGGDMLIERLVNKILDFNESATNLYQLAGDRSGSYFLEAVFECCNISIVSDLINHFILTNAVTYALNNTANFVLQAVLRRLTYHSLDDKATNIYLSIFSELTSDLSTFSQLLVKKAGVILWLVEASTNYGLVYNDSTNWCDRINTLVIEKSKDINEDLTQYLDRLIHKSNDNISNIILNAKLIGALIKGFVVSETSRSIVKAIVSLSNDTILHICTNNQLCKNILDVLVDTINESNNNTNILLQLIHKLKSNLTTISIHYTGQYLLKKLFDYCDINGKEIIASTMYESKEIIASTKEGRNSLYMANVDLFGRKPNDWRQLVMRKNKANEILNELGIQTSKKEINRIVTNTSISAISDNKSNVLVDSNDNDSENEENGDAINNNNNELNQNKRKRKRKRPNKNKSISNTDSLINNQVVPKDTKIISSNEDLQAIQSDCNENDNDIKVNKKVKSNNDKIDIQKIKYLKSSKLLSSKRIQEEIENIIKTK